MRELIDAVFARALANAHLDTAADAVAVPLPLHQEVVVTTDSFTVQPIEFPGGNIGSLAVHGIVNDLAVCGARPLYLTLSVILEEGLEIALLRRVIGALAHAARASGVAVVAGDTKVVERGDCDGMYLTMTGIGARPRGTALGLERIRAGDRVLVSGTTATSGSGTVVCPGDPAGQATYILDKIAASLSPLGATLSDVVRTRIYLRDADNWEAVSRVHGRYFGDIRPANTLVEVSRLIGDYEVEIEAEAVVDAAAAPPEPR